MEDHLAYILTSKRRNGPRLDKSYGNEQGWLLYPCYEEAKKALDGMDQDLWMILPVWVRSDEEAWENMRNEKSSITVTAGPIKKVMVRYKKQ